MCVEKSKQNAFVHLNAFVSLLRSECCDILSVSNTRVKLQDKAERRFLPETVMLCENHLAVPRVLKELNKCHSLCIKIQKVAEDRVRTP